MFLRSKQSGFTYLELILVVFVLAIIATAGGLYLGGSVSTRALEAAERDLTSMLREAQSNALGRVNKSDWSVRVWNSVPTATNPDSPCPTGICAELFSGTAYAKANVKRLVVFSSRVELSSPLEANFLDYIFEERTGRSIGSTTSQDKWISYHEAGTASALKAARYVPGNATLNGCAANWRCMFVDDPVNTVGSYNDIAMDPSGTVWIAYRDATAQSLKIARYVGSGGTGCANSTDTGAWTCEAVDAVGTNFALSVRMAIHPVTGKPWIAYLDRQVGNLKIAYQVDSGGANCAGATNPNTWTCAIMDTAALAINMQLSIAFSLTGEAWVAYLSQDATARLRVARYLGSGGSGCVSSAWSCQTVHYSGAASMSNPSINFHPVTGEAWVAFLNGELSALGLARNVGSGGSGCSGSTNLGAWSCELVVDGAENYGAMNWLAFSPDGTAWISFHQATAPGGEYLGVAKYTPGTLDGIGLSACKANWTCTVVDDAATPLEIGHWTYIVTDNTGNPWGTYQYIGDPMATNQHLKLAWSTPGTLASGSCAANWTCISVDDPPVNSASYHQTSILLSNHSIPVSFFLIANKSQMRSIMIGTEGGISIQ